MYLTHYLRVRITSEAGSIMRCLTPFVVASTLGACSLTGDEACAIQAAEPLITVELVADSASGAPVPVVFVSNVRYGDFPPLLATSLVDPARAPVRQATVEGDAVRCVVTCGFASSEGPYEMTISAPGFHARTVNFTADYNRLGDGCPRLQRDGFTLRTTLTKV